MIALDSDRQLYVIGLIDLHDSFSQSQPHSTALLFGLSSVSFPVGGADG